MELEDMKRQWSEIDARIKKIETENEAFRHKDKMHRASTEKDQLVKQYRCMTAVSLMFPMIINLSLRDVLSTMSLLAVVVFFLAMAVVLSIMWHGLERVDYGKMTSKEAVESILKYERMQRNKQIIGLSLAIPTGVTMLWDYYAFNPYIFYGGLVGVAIGTAIGLKAHFRIKHSYQTLRDTFAEELS